MTILKELWTKEQEDPEVKTTYQYVLDLKDRLTETCELAQKELRKASRKYKRNFDSKAKDRGNECRGYGTYSVANRQKQVTHAMERSI